ncbi:MAG: DUF2892 domain-containing protein [Clostridia bacterium]|nr:DUF2892 domain-containing protein [Clostridia bacterium]
MKKNVGKTDKLIRIILGVVLLSLLFIIDSGWRWIGLLGIVAIGTALINFCPLYTLIGVNTNREK